MRRIMVAVALVAAGTTGAAPAGASERGARQMYVAAEMQRRAEVCEVGQAGAALDPMAELLAWSFIQREAKVRQLQPLLPALASLEHLTTDQLGRLVDCLTKWKAAARTEQRILERHSGSEVAYELARDRRLTPGDLDRIIDRVEQARVKAREQVEQAARDDGAAPETTTGGLGEAQIEAVRQQLASCWSPPVGARDEALKILIRVHLEPDGTLRSAELQSRERMGEAFYRAAAESAMRAVRICSPLQGLPRDHYDAWKVLELTFDPQEMLGS